MLKFPDSTFKWNCSANDVPIPLVVVIPVTIPLNPVTKVISVIFSIIISGAGTETYGVEL